MSVVQPVDGRSTLESLRIGPYHVLIFVILLLAVLAGGLSQQSLPYVSAAITRDLALEPRALGALFGITMLGSGIGALLVGIIGDIVGPKRVVCILVLGFGVTTAIASAVNSLPELLVLRLILGFCIGGALPNVIALAVQFAPRRERGTIATIVIAGFPAGATLAGVMMVSVLPPDAWRWAFLITGVGSIALVPFLLLAVPESLPILLKRPGGQEQVRRVLSRLGARPEEGHISWGEAAPSSRVPLFDMFQSGRARTTLLLWAIFILAHIDVYFLANWLPDLIERAHETSARALNLTSFFNFGGTVGVVLLGGLIDLMGIKRVLITLFLVGSASLAFLALGSASSAAYAPVLVVAGIAFLGGSGALNALPALLYPATMRSTAGGWAIGVGHIGSIAGPFIGGYLLQAGWQPKEALQAATVLPLLALALTLLLVIPSGAIKSAHR